MWRDQKVNPKPQTETEEGQTTQQQREKRQKDRQHNGKEKKDKRTDNTTAKRKKTKGQTTIYQTPHRKPKIEQNELQQKPGVNAGAPEGLAVPASHVTPVV
jgi:hypothetical protein